MLTGTASTGFDIGGAATADMSLVTLADTDNSGTTAEAVRIDSFGGSNYSLGTDWVLVNYDGKMSTQTTEGAVSRDGRIIFLVNTNPGKFPTLVLYTR